VKKFTSIPVTHSRLNH